MCRLAFIPGHAPIKAGQLRRLFDHLERSCGGHGNGLLLVSPTGEEEHGKGLGLTVKQCTDWAFPLIRKGWNCYFHSRVVSVGWQSDEQCHPHKIAGKEYCGWLAHNGTWWEGNTLAKFLRCGSDTAALACVLGKFGLDGAEDAGLFPTSGVFLIYGGAVAETPAHRAVLRSGDLRYDPKTGIWASEFPKGLADQSYDVAPGRHLLLKPAKQAEPKAYFWKGKCDLPAEKVRGKLFNTPDSPGAALFNRLPSHLTRDLD